MNGSRVADELLRASSNALLLELDAPSVERFSPDAFVFDTLALASYGATLLRGASVLRQTGRLQVRHVGDFQSNNQFVTFHAARQFEFAFSELAREGSPLRSQ